MRFFASRKIVAAAAATLAVVIVAMGLAADSRDASAASATVATSGFRFSPNTVTINVGDQVTFTFGGTSTHNATSVTGAWTAIPLNSTNTSGATGAFTTPGTYYYYCTIHAEAASATEAHVTANDAMVGKIVVQAAGSPTPTTPAATATATATATQPPPSNAPCKLTVADATVGANTKELVVTFAQQARVGYVAVHEASATGGPGNVIGFTQRLAGGSQNTNLKVPLDRALKDGERVWPMLHTEDNGNSTYDGAAIDKPTVDASCGNPATGNIATFPMTVKVTVAPPAVGTGLAKDESSHTLLFAVGGILALLAAGALTTVAARARR